MQRCHCQKKLPSLLSSQEHFPGIFASEAMTLPEIDHVSFLVEHAQTFFAGERISSFTPKRMRGRFTAVLVVHRRKMSAHALLKMARDLFRVMSLALRQKCPRNVVEMKEAMAAFFWL